MTYDELMDKYNDLHVVEMDLKDIDNLKGLYYNGSIAIEKTLSNIEKACVLAEEIGHHFTAHGDITNLSKINNRKQERKGRAWAFNEQIGLTGLVNAFKARCTCAHEVAEFLNVSESFLNEAISYYKEKYGNSTALDNYIIFFEPSLAILRRFN